MGLILTIFTYNNDFLYKDKIIKITNIKTIMEEIDTNELNIKEKYKYIKIIGNLTNTKEIGKKETYKYEETSSSVVTEKYKIGDKVIIKKGEISSSVIELIEKDNNISIENLKHSIKEIGKNILGTTTNTLLFASIRSFMTLIIWFITCKYNVFDILNNKIPRRVYSVNIQFNRLYTNNSYNSTNNNTQKNKRQIKICRFSRHQPKFLLHR